MKEYLKKLGKTKFQAYLLVTIVNIVTLIAYLKGYLKIDQQIEQWMPLINLGVQMIATMIYQWVEGSIDKEAQKQQVYVMPGSAAPAESTTQAAAPETSADNLTWEEIIQKVQEVNEALNESMSHIDQSNLSDLGKKAVNTYLKIHDIITAISSASDTAKKEGEKPSV